MHCGEQWRHLSSSYFCCPSAFLFTLKSQYQSHSWPLNMYQQEMPHLITEGSFGSVSYLQSKHWQNFLLHILNDRIEKKTVQDSSTCVQCLRKLMCGFEETLGKQFCDSAMIQNYLQKWQWITSSECIFYCTCSAHNWKNCHCVEFTAWHSL